MPLRNILLQSNLDPEDADLLETLYNQNTTGAENEEHRRDRAAGLVQLFVDGERDRQKLINYLVDNARATSPA